MLEKNYSKIDRKGIWTVFGKSSHFHFHLYFNIISLNITLKTFQLYHNSPSKDSFNISSSRYVEDSHLNGESRQCESSPLVDEDDQEEEVRHGAGRRRRHLQLQIIHRFSQQFRTLNSKQQLQATLVICGTECWRSMILAHLCLPLLIGKHLGIYFT